MRIMGSGKGDNMKKNIIGIFVCMLMCATVLMVAETTIAKKTTQSFSDPEVDWERTYGGEKIDWGSCVQQTADGGYIISGTYYRNAWSLWYSNLYLIKTDANGIEEWHQIQGTYDREHVAQYVQQTNDGGYIIAGYQGTGGDYDAILEKTDNEGNVIWIKIFGKPDVYDTGRSVQQTTDGGYILTGWTQSYGAGSCDAWLIKTDANGNEIWNRTFGGANSDNGNYVQITSDGGYMIIGTTESFGNLGSVDAWLIKTDENGYEQWNRTFGSPDYEDVLNGQQTTDGGYILVGTKPLMDGTTDIWVVKTNANGTIVWESTYGGTDYDTGYSIQQTTDGGFFITGDSTDTSSGVPDVYVIKTDANGNEEWSKKIDKNQSEDRGYYGIQNADGDYIITGYTGAYLDEASDVWLIKLTEENGAANIEIEITGGQGASAVISNTGTVDAENVSWTLEVHGGLFGRINKTVTGTIDHLAVGASVSVTTGMFFGLGNIEVSASADEVSAIKEGIQFFIFTIIK
jgi:hypothetical protein